MNKDEDVNTNPEVTPEPRAELEQSTALAQTTLSAAPTKKRPFRLVLLALIAAAFIVLIGGSVFGYTMWYQNPDKVVHDAMIHAFTEQTGTVKGSLTYSSDNFKLDITLNSTSAKDGEDFVVGAKIIIPDDETEQEYSATGNGRVIDDTLYVKISGIQGVVEDVTGSNLDGQIPPYASSIFEKIEGRWISIKASDYYEVDESIASQQTCFLELLDETKTDSSMLGEVASVYKGNQVLIIEEELGSKMVNGVDSLGFKVAINEGAARSFIEGVEGTQFGKELKNCNNDIDFNEIAKQYTKMVSESKDKAVTELWVSKIGHEITEVSSYGQGSSDNEINIIVNPVFGGNATIEIPEGAVSLKTVLSEIQEAILEYSGISVPKGPTPSRFNTGDVNFQIQSAA